MRKNLMTTVPLGSFPQSMKRLGCISRVVLLAQTELQFAVWGRAHYTAPIKSARILTVFQLQLDLAKLPSTFSIRKICNFSILLKRSEEHTSELQSRPHLVCRLL